MKSPKFTFVLTGTVPASSSRLAVVEIARDAARAWSSVPCSSVRISIADDPLSPAIVGNDHVFRLVFRTEVWGKNGQAGQNQYSPAMLAKTSTFVNGTESTQAAVIEDADIEINAVNYHWPMSEPAGADQQYAPSLRKTLMHEFGHTLGLGHTCSTAIERSKIAVDDKGHRRPLCGKPSETFMQTLMYPDTGHPEPECALPARLSSDEIHAICKIYPVHHSAKLAPFKR